MPLRWSASARCSRTAASTRPWRGALCTPDRAGRRPPTHGRRPERRRAWPTAPRSQIRRGVTMANLAGQFAQTDYELVNIAHYQCRRYPPQVFGEATVQPAGFWRQAFPGMQATEWCGEYAAREGA